MLNGMDVNSTLTCRNVVGGRGFVDVSSLNLKPPRCYGESILFSINRITFRDKLLVTALV